VVRALDASVVTGGVALYDLIPAGLLPLKANLIARLAEIPLVPVVR
jgi:hypothetical protein